MPGTVSPGQRIGGLRRVFGCDGKVDLKYSEMHHPDTEFSSLTR